MTILFDATRPVKPAKATSITRNRPSRPFGAGLLAYSPNHRATHTVADEAEYLAMIARDDRDRREARNQAARDYDAHLEERYQHARMMDRVCRGPMF